MHFYKILSGSFMDIINPLNYMSHQQYDSFWQMLFSTILQGFWARFLAFTTLALALFFLIYLKRPGLSIVFIVISTIATYFGGVFSFMFSALR
jgi:hypothetical protein